MFMWCIQLPEMDELKVKKIVLDVAVIVNVQVIWMVHMRLYDQIIFP